MELELHGQHATASVIYVYTILQVYVGLLSIICLNLSVA